MTDAHKTIWAKDGHDSWGQLGDWYRDNKRGGTLYHHDDTVTQLQAKLAEVKAERDKAQRFGQDMVARAASGGVLDGYRELGARAAAAETRADAAQAAITRAYQRGLDAAASYHDEIALHDQSGIEYSLLVGIPISNRADLERSVTRAEMDAKIIRALTPPTDLVEKALENAHVAT